MNGSYDPLISDAAARYGVPFQWVKAIIGTESNFDPGAYRAEPRINDASYGLMQILTATAEGLGFWGDPQDLFDPAINIDLGTKLLGQLISRYGQDFRNVYSAYNSGSPTRWQNSAQVLHNVERAETWLARVMEEHPGVVAAAGGLGLLVLAALAWFFLRGKG